MIRESLDQWPYVLAAYGVTVLATVLLAGWSWIAMRRAEKRRENTRGK